ncbi:hypothetical protein C8R47DRAFT_1171811 [Mycena vitilis]|nr:hypothetical protein C8R47DRAFT_1171811 [Mycena vitilis]
MLILTCWCAVAPAAYYLELIWPLAQTGYRAQRQCGGPISVMRGSTTSAQRQSRTSMAGERIPIRPVEGKAWLSLCPRLVGDDKRIDKQRGDANAG